MPGIGLPPDFSCSEWAFYWGTSDVNILDCCSWAGQFLRAVYQSEGLPIKHQKVKK